MHLQYISVDKAIFSKRKVFLVKYYLHASGTHGLRKCLNRRMITIILLLKEYIQQQNQNPIFERNFVSLGTRKDRGTETGQSNLWYITRGEDGEKISSDPQSQLFSLIISKLFLPPWPFDMMKEKEF